MFQRHDSISSIFIQPDFEILYKEADHLLESIWYEASASRVLLGSLNKTREEVNHFLNREWDEDLLYQTYYDYTDMNDEEFRRWEGDDIYYVSDGVITKR